MSQKKRHLSQQQIRNQAKNRNKTLAGLITSDAKGGRGKAATGIDAIVASFASYLAANPDSPVKQGIVVSRYGKRATVMPLAVNEQQEFIFTDQAITCYMKAALEDLVVGDYVYYHQINQDYFIIDYKERDNLIARAYFGKMRNIVANVTTMIITSSINPDLNTEIIDRYLIVAQNNNIKPLILINKVDLLDGPVYPSSQCPQSLLEQATQADTCLLPGQTPTAVQVQAIINYYTSLGYHCIPVSANDMVNIKLIQESLADQGLHIFVGQTGVGKSSLINAIFGGELLEVGAINDQTRLGKHTTTTSRLLKIDDHSALIDSPGIREFSLENYEQDQVLSGYIELHNPDYACRFSDCNHVNNLGCGIARLYQDGLIAEFRYNNLHKLLQAAGESTTK